MRYNFAHFSSTLSATTQILEDLEGKSKPSNNCQLLIIHPDFQTFSDSTILYSTDLKNII